MQVWRPPHRQRIDTRVTDGVPTAFKIDNLLRPQRPHDLDLFLATLATIVKILIQRFVLDRIPTRPDPQAQPATAEHINLRRLLRDQSSVTLP